MTIEQIYALADERYKLGPGACRRERLQAAYLKALFIEKLKKENGLVPDKNKVNS